MLVSYIFNKTKSYGSKGAEIIVEDIAKYPYPFDIIYDFKTNNTNSQFTDPEF